MAAVEIEAWVEQQLGSPVRARRAVAGGCIHSAWRLELADGRCVFAKTNRAAALPLLAAERQGLAALARWAPPELQLPEPLALGLAGRQAVLLLGWVELVGVDRRAGAELQADRRWAALGGALAALHRASAAANARPGAGCYGFSADNFIGSTAQANGWLPQWSRFFVERRLAPQLALVAEAGQPFRSGEVLLERAEALLARHGCPPALVHGDLWSGNAALLVQASTTGVGTIFDPAAHWADREVDLAMARLFGGFPPSFFAGYEQAWPLPANWPQRLELYNLYHLLNHAHLFGAGYRHQAQAVIDRLLT